MVIALAMHKGANVPKDCDSGLRRQAVRFGLAKIGNKGDFDG